MEGGGPISRKQFIGLVGSAAAALVLGRIAGMFGSKTSSISFIKELDKDAYGTTPYGGTKA
jgi:hypothetical protein